jgi:hypothetical protein
MLLLVRQFAHVGTDEFAGNFRLIVRRAANPPPLCLFVRRKKTAGRHLAGFSLHPLPASFRPFARRHRSKESSSSSLHSFPLVPARLSASQNSHRSARSVASNRKDRRRFAPSSATDVSTAPWAINTAGGHPRIREMQDSADVAIHLIRC